MLTVNAPGNVNAGEIMADTSTKLLAAIAAIGGVSGLSGWSVVIQTSGDVEAVKTQATQNTEDTRDSLAWAREQGMLFTLAELPDECAKRYPEGGGGE